MDLNPSSLVNEYSLYAYFDFIHRDTDKEWLGRIDVFDVRTEDDREHAHLVVFELFDEAPDAASQTFMERKLVWTDSMVSEAGHNKIQPVVDAWLMDQVPGELNIEWRIDLID